MEQRWSQRIGSFFFNDTATTEIYTLSLHDALPISAPVGGATGVEDLEAVGLLVQRDVGVAEDDRVGLGEAQPHAFEAPVRSEEHTSELQSRQYLVCRLLLEKKKLITLTSLSLTSSS